MKKRIMFSLDQDIIQKLEKMSEQTGYKKSEIVAIAIKILINKRNLQKGEK